jgi:uncharacterized protein (TIGR02996 family)
MLDEAFLRDIIEHPEEDAPRLVYADWLEETGGAPGAVRAEFIRAQIECAGLPEDGPQAVALRDRATQLLADHGSSWDPLLRRHGEDVRYVRGFAEHIALRASVFLSQGERLFAAAPLRELRLEKGRQKIDQIVQSPLLARLAALEMPYGQLGAAEAAVLAASPHLANLRLLELRSNGLGDEGVRALAGSAHLTGLTRLNLGHNAIYPPGAQALAGSPHLTNLAELDLHFNDVGAQGAIALARSPLLERLAHLDLGFNEIQDHGARALADHPWRGLTSLVLSHGEITDAGFLALFASDALVHRLTRLELQYNAMGDAGASALAAVLPAGLTLLNLSKNGIGPAGAEALAHSPSLSGLLDLDLEGNPIGPAGARALADSPHLGRLARLTLGSRDAGAAGNDALRQRFGERIRWYG